MKIRVQLIKESTSSKIVWLEESLQITLDQNGHPLAVISDSGQLFKVGEDCDLFFEQEN